MPIEVLDPTYGGGGVVFQRAPRLPSLAGKTVGLISNGKKGTGRFFAALERELIDVHGAGQVILRAKSNYSAPADPPIMEEARQWDAAFTGIGD